MSAPSSPEVLVISASHGENLALAGRFAETARQQGAEAAVIDLTSGDLPQPRLGVKDGVVMVPAYTDLKLHDITSGPNDPNREELDMNKPAGSPGFFAGNGKFLTRKLWGVGRKPNYFHHGKFTTMRDAILAHSGEALDSRQAFESASDEDRNALIEFLRSLRVLPPGTRSLIVDENGSGRSWPPRQVDQGK
jgi:CxxC motif-containing protein (DUF1111 family)